MISLSMLRISPKLISVELNRVGTNDILKRNIPVVQNPTMWGTRDISNWTNEVGRFPTQLFTNIKNDRYKYDKNIT